MSRDPEKTWFVYILTNKKNGTLYVGWTTDLIRRVEAHKARAVPGFTREYGLERLVYVESFEEYGPSLEREKRLKRWRRAWKIALIEKENPGWEDLAASGLLGPG